MARRPDNIMELATKEAERIYGLAMEEVLSLSHQNSRDVLLRRFSRGYGKLNVEEIVQLRQALGHRDDESDPCKVCRIIARKEYDLAED